MIMRIHAYYEKKLGIKGLNVKWIADFEYWDISQNLTRSKI